MNKYFRRKLKGIRSMHNSVLVATDETIPDEYIMLDYLESSGTQYINTSIVPFSGIGVKITYYCKSPLVTSSSYGVIFGSRVRSTIAEFFLASYRQYPTGIFSYGNAVRTAGGIVQNTKQTMCFQNLKYTNTHYKNLCDAIDALNEFKEIFASYRDDKIVDAYVLNEITGKQIRP